MYKLKDKWSTHTTTGIVSKGVYTKDGIDYLVKGNSDRNTLEPISEVLVSIILKNLLIPENDYVEYLLEPLYKFPEIKTYNLDYVCVCKKLDFDIFQFYNTVNPTRKGNDYLKLYIGTRNLSIYWLFRMFLIDAFVGNKDRHLNNFDIKYDKDYLFFENAPMLDFGASLLYNLKESELKEYTGNKIGPDSCKPLADTHKKQIHKLSRCIDNKEVFEYVGKEDFFEKFKIEAEPIFALLTEKRKNAITPYLYQRWDFYIKPFMKPELGWK